MKVLIQTAIFAVITPQIGVIKADQLAELLLNLFLNILDAMTDKGKFLQKFNEAFAKGDFDYIIENVTDHIVWTMVGNRTVKGKEAFSQYLKSMGTQTSNELSISNIITHGASAAVDGTIKMTDKKGNMLTYAFCDVYTFSGFKNPKIKTMTSYVIEIDK